MEQLETKRKKVTILTDRSGRVTELACKRLRWHNNFAGSENRGLANRKGSHHLLVGHLVHQGLQTLWTSGGDLSLALQGLQTQFHSEVENFELDSHSKSLHGMTSLRGMTSLPQGWQEQLDLSMALTEAWYRSQWREFNQQFKVLAVEPELRSVLFAKKLMASKRLLMAGQSLTPSETSNSLIHSTETEEVDFEVVLMLRPDGILERRRDGVLQQCEIKTKSSVNDNYIKGWEHDLQLIGQQVGLRQWAVDNGLGERQLGGARIEVLLKGMRKRNRAGEMEQQSPLIYAYVKDGASDFLEAGASQVSWEWKRGFSRRLASSIMPLSQWLSELPPEELVSRCLVLPEVNPTDDEIEIAKRQWGFAAIAEWMALQQVRAAGCSEEALDQFFPQTTGYCFQMGKCSKFDLCFTDGIKNDPIGSGKFINRVPNHPEIVEGE